MNLNAAEKKWIAELQAVLDACPSKRLGFYTIGDPTIYIYDLRKEKQINDEQDRGGDFCQAVCAVGADTDASLEFPSNVHSTAG